MPLPGAAMAVNYHTPNTTASKISQRLNWGLQDDELWCVGMEYDLMDPGGQVLASMDLLFQMLPYVSPCLRCSNPRRQATEHSTTKAGRRPGLCLEGWYSVLNL